MEHNPSPRWDLLCRAVLPDPGLCAVPQGQTLRCAINPGLPWTVQGLLWTKGCDSYIYSSPLGSLDADLKGPGIDRPIAYY